MSQITPIKQKQIAFQGREVTAVLVQDDTGRENIFVPLRPLVEGMGMQWSAQLKRIRRNPVLDEVCQFVSVTDTNSKGGNPNKLAIPISKLNGFLFGINANRVKLQLRPLILAYQKQCYDVLFGAFNGTESMRQFYTAVGFDERWIEARVSKHYSGGQLSDIWLLNGIPIEQHDQLFELLNKTKAHLTFQLVNIKRLKTFPMRQIYKITWPVWSWQLAPWLTKLPIC